MDTGVILAAGTVVLACNRSTQLLQSLVDVAGYRLFRVGGRVSAAGVVVVVGAVVDGCPRLDLRNNAQSACSASP